MANAPEAQLTYVAPFFIIRDLATSMAFYRDALGFQVTLMAPDDNPFFAIFRRDGVSVMVKAVSEDVPPLPNPERHPWARWDAFAHTPDPDRLAGEFAARGVAFHAALADTDDRLRGFEVRDPDGYVWFFGRPLTST